MMKTSSLFLKFISYFDFKRDTITEFSNYTIFSCIALNGVLYQYNDGVSRFVSNTWYSDEDIKTL
jgi:hypothetical protein